MGRPHFGPESLLLQDEQILLADGSGNVSSYTLKGGILGLNGFLIIEIEFGTGTWSVTWGGVTFYTTNVSGTNRLFVYIFNRNSASSQYLSCHTMRGPETGTNTLSTASADTTKDVTFSFTGATVKSILVRLATLG